MPILKFQNCDLLGHKKECGSMELKNQTENTADLYLYGDIMSESWGEYGKYYYPDDTAPSDVKDFFDEIGEVDTINVHINSGGGSVYGGIAIHNLLKNHKAKVVVYVDGMAASIASVIAMAGDEIHIPKNAQMMIHKPLCYVSGNADDMRKQADVLDGCQKLILNTYMLHAKEGVTSDTINQLIDKETWLSGEECLQYFDIKVEEENIAVAAVESSFFDKYQNLPKQFAKQEEPKQEIDMDKLVDKLAEKLKEMNVNLELQDNKEEELRKLEEELDYL